MGVKAWGSSLGCTRGGLAEDCTRPVRKATSSNIGRDSHVLRYYKAVYVGQVARDRGASHRLILILLLILILMKMLETSEGAAA